MNGNDIFYLKLVWVVTVFWAFYKQIYANSRYSGT